MSKVERIEAAMPAEFDPHGWMGLVLDHFARAEQAIGHLSIALGLPITNGSLGSMQELRARLATVEDRKVKALSRRMARWSANRPFRHLLAHATITCLYDKAGQTVIVTRHLPRDASDVTPDRVWTSNDQRELLRQVANDSRSICDLVRNIQSDPASVRHLRPI